MTTYTLESSREWYNNLPSKSASAAMIIRHNDTYLLTKDDYKMAMTFPGGVIDSNESAMHAAIREVKEEIGITLNPDSVTFFSVSYIGKKNGFNDRFQFYFFTEIDEVMAESMHFEKGIEYHKWVSAAEIKELTGERSAYAAISAMLNSGDSKPYFEV